ncbi:MAG: SDR family oxidoreductase [Aliivibrio sp.]|uniref:UDP-glucose 4-epimerase family protein n=1 Tax=Aliivibrio sp. TaxID=1872443 RepID=UPI001A5D8C13|nr:SDR family oxidoreductase [Aliivibrio sp.]
MNILITGGSGFIGCCLISELKKNVKNELFFTQRDKKINADINEVYIASIDGSTVYTLPKTLDTIIHCAARAHIMHDESGDPLKEYREINTFGTLNLAKQAAEAGVKRFIFVSSIKVNGESTSSSVPFMADDKKNPQDDYGQSKAEAEDLLLELAPKIEMEVVIIRPTLVYGPGVKANFASLMNLVSKGLPLPFGRITNNRRSLVSVRNLVDLIITCIDHPKAANQVFLVSDDNDVSTASMVKKMSTALGKPNRMLPVPLWCFNLIGKVFSKQGKVDRLLGSLQVDISHTKETLDWTPPQTLEEGFKETAEAFVLSKKLNKEKNT